MPYKEDIEAFGGESTMTDGWLFGNKPAREHVDGLYKEVDKMLLNLYRDECMHKIARQKFGPDAEGVLPPIQGKPLPGECDDLDCPRCDNVIAEYQVLADLKWILQRMDSGDFYEVRDSWKNRIKDQKSLPDYQQQLPDFYYFQTYMEQSMR